MVHSSNDFLNATAMNSFARHITAQDANAQFETLLTQVSEGYEHVVIQSPGSEPVYLISQQDYELFQQLLQTLEDKQDIELADARTVDPQQDLIAFDRFFATLDDEDAPVSN